MRSRKSATLSGLKGKRVAVSGLADSSYIMLQEVFKKNGLQGGGREVVTIVMGDSPSRFNALLSGTIDATPVTLPYNFRAEDANFRELVSFIKEDLVLLAGGLAMQENLYNKDPALVRTFLRATLKGFIYTSENRAGTIQVLAKNIKITEQLAAKTYDLGRTAMTPDGSLSEDAQRKAVDMVVKTPGVLKILLRPISFLIFPKRQKCTRNCEPRDGSRKGRAKTTPRALAFF